MFTEIQRKRKSDICQYLKKTFETYEQSYSSEDYLFNQNTMNRMNQYLKFIHDKYINLNLYQPSKNWGSSYKSQRNRSQYKGKNIRFYK